MSYLVRFPATHKFYWAGQEVSYICAGHLPQLQAIISALGYPLVIEPLAVDDVQLGRQQGSCPMPKGLDEVRYT